MQWDLYRYYPYLKSSTKNGSIQKFVIYCARRTTTRKRKRRRKSGRITTKAAARFNLLLCCLPACKGNTFFFSHFSFAFHRFFPCAYLLCARFFFYIFFLLFFFIFFCFYCCCCCCWLSYSCESASACVCGRVLCNCSSALRVGERQCQRGICMGIRLCLSP